MTEYNKLLDSLIDHVDINKVTLPNSVASIQDIIGDVTLSNSLVLIDKLINLFHRNIGFVYKLRVNPDVLKPEEQVVLTEVLSWTLASINNWKKTDEKSVKLLNAILVIIEFISCDGYLWNIFPIDLNNENPEVLVIVEKFIKSSSFSINLPNDAPEYAKEFLKEMQNAISENDLTTLSECLQVIKNSPSISPDILFKSSCRCLAVHDIECLAKIVLEKNDFYSYLFVNDCLSTHQAIQLAVLCGSDLLGLIVLENIYGNEQSELSDSDINSTVDIIKQMTADQVKLKIWMEIFNKYPVRYQSLQKALGQFLVVAGESVMTAYIDSIELTSSNSNGYLLVTECLKIFENSSAEDLQKLLWKLAFERWDKWDYGFVPENSFVFKRSISSIDYAVSKYFLNCMQKEEVITYVDNLLEQMNALDTQWHNSHSDLISKWHVLFSKYALISYATDSDDTDYLHFVPDIPAEFNNSYSKIKYHINSQIQ